ncbi:hypothetical protein PGIGA_G00018440 [Pangasianodon gigas]|uniref:Uncharacterized protein n=1 Tax=Pangasianodon gigas TaxID=30993 RepID=A0ACC5WWU1_PANGG|nr:hypothetical protein [Pangasianodon gigas]
MYWHSSFCKAPTRKRSDKWRLHNTTHSSADSPKLRGDLRLFGWSLWDEELSGHTVSVRICAEECTSL